ncbi:electroneutral sodium bicarbonate exchanger 1-like isoform X1 [Accipiter gentilis]|uniref:electroneutral sodium bicarbonate exchanger 1-like isoform X1 n=1 Tax=Astur gentilis TaxID=8957 RepID=UPI00210F3C32|nr:electroneutral sodium bicarbonate exchanger 1-like isoform X1 [Accipiter gentilis]XP_049653345.1 electroneutral sodium bicarbonate exchanger 1-like isoform X1 [Accipiter gentilis]
MHLEERKVLHLLKLGSRKAKSCVLDLKDAFVCLPLHEARQNLLTFEWEKPKSGRKTQLTWTALPQGFKNRPTIFGNRFAKDLESWETPSEEGKLLQYVDDIPIATKTEKDCTTWAASLLNFLGLQGYRVSKKKAQECQYLRGEFQGPACGRDGPYTPDVFFWCCILFFATFALSSFLKKFKTSRYFPTRVRSTVSDFAVFLTIVIMVLLDFVVGIPLPKLQVPHAFKPTRDDRGWFINPIGPNPWWTVLAALVPALLCTILIFMDQQISAVTVNRKEHKLKKGCGYHLDLFVVAVMLGVCSVMGLPWFVAATVLSITHVNSLKVESDCSAPGEQPKFLGIREQRVTGLLIFVLMGCSVFFTSVLKFIPMPVLYGVFLYMGVSLLRGIQFFDRLKLFWMPAKHQPDFIYLRHVPLRKVHFFTAIQLTCLVLLWTIKVSRAAIIFPMMVLALVFVRKAMDFCFSKRELSFLDDLMPERKKKLDDARNEAGEEEEESRRAMEAAATASSVQLNVGKTSDVDIPKQSSDGTDPSEIVILDEMSQTTVWKALTLKTETL